MALVNALHEEDDALNAARSALLAGKPAVVYRRIIADLDTPVSAYLKLTKGETHSCLLESVEGGEIRGRYSIIGFAPDRLLKIEGDTALVGTSDDSLEPIDGAPLDALRQQLAESEIELPESLPPMAAGWVGYMGYDLVRQMERLGPQKPDPIELPTALLIRPTIMAVFDSIANSITIVTPVRPSGDNDGNDIDTILEHARQRLDETMERLYAPLPRNSGAGDIQLDDQPVSNTPKDTYEAMVNKAKDYILAGDIFQVVLSQRFSQPFDLPPFSLYRALRRTNPSPFLYHLSFGDMAIVGSSPEILVRLRDNKVTIRPIAGTRPRGETTEQDSALENELLADPKELSEHLMLLDLGRNDVGRVAADGSVAVTAQNTIERYSHVMHIVSNVEGELRDDKDMIDALAAGFPAGTVSGAPKVRAMEIIDELELEGRSAYAGAVGYFSACGDMDTAIVLRTGIIKDGTLYVQAGAGIVADSKPEMEQAECEAKASALFYAAGEAKKAASANS